MRPRKTSGIVDAINFVPEELLPADSSRVPISDIVLASIALAGVISVALIAPNAVQLFKYVKLKQKPKYDFRYRVPEVVRRLEEKGYIALLHKNFTAKAVLTKKGKEALLKKKTAHALARYEKPATWDGKWRFVIFDVKEIRKTRRDRFRDQLKRLGFIHVQNSVWVFPYECEEMIMLLKMEKEIGGDVLYIEADRVENEHSLRLAFNL